MATSSDPAAPPTTATIGMRVSGIAVDTPASRLPTAPCPSSSFVPSHSIPFVNSIAPASRIAKLKPSDSRAAPVLIVRPYRAEPPRLLATSLSMTSEQWSMSSISSTESVNKRTGAWAFAESSTPGPRLSSAPGPLFWELAVPRGQ